MVNYEEILSRYKSYREITCRYNNEVFDEYVKTEEIREAAMQLGVWEENAFVLDTEDQIGVVMDHAFYGVRVGPNTVVERCVEERRPTAEGDEAVVLDAMSKMYHSLFQVNGVVEGVGIRAYDAFYGREVFLADVSFSRTSLEGVIIASRVLPFDDFVMTTGAALPVDAETLDLLLPMMENSGLTPRTLPLASPEQRDRLTAEIIRTCIECEASLHIAYADPDEIGPEDDVIPIDELQGKIGRNDPCPCGSGKKYKKCCGR